MTVTLEIIDLNLQRDHHFFVLFEFPICFALLSTFINKASKPTKKNSRISKGNKPSQEQQHHQHPSNRRLNELSVFFEAGEVK